MKLVDLQRIAPKGGRVFVSCALPTTGEPRWLEIDEMHFVPSGAAEVLARIDRVRNHGSHLRWRAVVHPGGPLAKNPTQTFDWDPIAPVIPAESVAAEHVSARRSGPYIVVEREGKRYEVFPSARSIVALLTIATVTREDTPAGSGPYIDVSLNDAAEMLLVILARILAHGREEHPEDTTIPGLRICGDYADLLAVFASIYITIHNEEKNR